MIKFAHRGASGYAPENTLGSIKKAIELGAKAFEIDVQLTKDNEVVVHHDYDLGRIFAGEGKIKDHYLKDLKWLPVKNKFSEEYSHEKIPTLKEVLDILPEGSFLNIEIKATEGEKREIEKEVLEVIKDYPKENILISSFDHEILKRAANENKDIKIGILFEELPENIEEYIENIGFKPYSINPWIKKINYEQGKRIKDLGYQLFIFTVKEEKDMEKAKEVLADGVFTDYIDRF